jgi:parallel beta-helix repeat protein
MCLCRLRLLVLAVILLIVAAILPAAGYAITIRVPGDQPTIQAGLNAAGTGDTVLVAPGVYNEALFWPFKNGIVLIGSGEDSTVIVGNASEPVILMVDVVKMDTSTVIRGFHFAKGGDAGIALSGASPIVELCGVDSTQNGPGIHCSAGSAAVIRHCQIRNNNGSGVKLESCDPTIVIGWSTITGNTSSDGGGGIWCYSTSALIVDNTVSGNTGYLSGGVFCEGSSPTITHNTIGENNASVGFVGGIYCQFCDSVTIIYNKISMNSGGGIYFDGYYSSRATIAHNTISENSGTGIFLDVDNPSTITENVVSGNRSGGISLWADAATVSRNTISGNTSSGGGGGLYCRRFGSILENRIIGNTTSSCGGGIYCEYFEGGIIADNTISGNAAVYDGGGVYCYSSSPTVSHNTLTCNNAGGNGGAVSCTSNSNPQLSSNTVTENHADGLGDGLYTIDSAPTLSYCNIAYNGYGLYNKSLSPTPRSRNDWWGHSSGPWHPGNPGGLGDSLSSYAWDFTPWLTQADTLAPPIPPRGLVAEGFSECSIQLSWEAVPIADIAGYKVYLGRDTTRYSYTDTFDDGNVTQCIVGGLACDSTYRFAVTCYDRLGNESWYSREVTVTTVVAVPDLVGVPTALRLEGNYPNPFNPQTNIVYSLPSEGRAELAVYDVRGRRLVILVDRVEGAGRHSVVWNGRDENGSELASGVYFVRLEFGGDVQKRKIVLVR